jgi:hypothetical protein
MLKSNLWVSIYAQAYDADFIAPFFLVLLKHMLVVCHGSLARPAPSCPKVKQDYLTRLMLNLLLILGQNIKNILYRLKLVPYSDLGINLDHSSFRVDPNECFLIS